MQLGSVLACVALFVGQASGDGGVPVASAAGEGGVRTLLMRPAQPRVGQAEFTVLGELPPGAMIRVSAPDERDALVVPWLPGRAAGVREASVDFEAAGAWRIMVGLPDQPPLLQASIEVGPAAPSWVTRLPWLLAWVPVALLLALRNRAVSYTPRGPRA